MRVPSPRSRRPPPTSVALEKVGDKRTRVRGPAVARVPDRTFMPVMQLYRAGDTDTTHVSDMQAGPPRRCALESRYRVDGGCSILTALAESGDRQVKFTPSRPPRSWTCGPPGRSQGLIGVAHRGRRPCDYYPLDARGEPIRCDSPVMRGWDARDGTVQD